MREPADAFEQPDARPVTDKLYELRQPYAYRWDLLGVANRITVPEGFRWDGASVPRLVWTLTGLRPDGLIRAASLIHDWLYTHGGLLPEGSHQSREAGSSAWRSVRGRWTRRDADRLFGRMMREAGVAPFRRRLAYLAVRLFGGLDWRD